MWKRILLLCAIAAPAVAYATAEICGNGIDDNANGMTDEGCAPTLTTGVCESPLSCGLTGMISWATGALHYDLPPDINPTVPYGPAIGFKRFYTSQFSPGSNPTSVNKTPLGPNWQHTYLSYVNAFGSGGTNYVTWHTAQGRDVLFTYSMTTGGWAYYTPQYTDHVMSLAQNTASPYQFQVQLLTGETLVYNSVGQLTQIWDTENPTPNVVNIAWDSTNYGNVSTVTDASGERRLLFSYTGGLMQTMQYQLLVSGTWTTEHTTTYGYTTNISGVTQDATSHWYTPASSSEWTTLLAGTGIPNPTDLWLLQGSAAPFADSIGSAALSISGTVSTQQSVSGWSRKAVTLAAGSTAFLYNDTAPNGLGNPGSGATSTLVLADITAQPSADALVALTGDSNGLYAIATPSGTNTLPKAAVYDGGTVTSATGADAIGSGVRPWVLRTDGGLTPTFDKLDDGLETVSVTPTRSVSANSFFILGGAVQPSPAIGYLYVTQWATTGLSDLQSSTLIHLMENVGHLSSVTIGSQLAQQYTYANNLLTNISDGGSDLIASFAYSSTTSGEVNQVNTPHGTVGLDYASSRASCSGETLLYFNAAMNPSNPGVQVACGSDGDCSADGGFCGGKTSSSGSTGLCFQAGRCLTTSTVGNEYVVTNVWPVGSGGSGSSNCTGACADVSQYFWTTPSGGDPVIAVAAKEDGQSDFTVTAYNTNGLPTQISYGATNGSGSSANRVEYLTYDTLFPGRVATISRQSDLSSSTCTGGSGSACDFTEYVYNDGSGSDHQLYQVTHIGNTYNSSGSATQMTSTTTFSHDSKARTTEIDGAVSGIKTTFDYYSSSDPTLDGRMQDYKLYASGSGYLEPQVLTYDVWGHPTSLQAPDGNLTCDTYDSSRAYLTQRRKAGNGQTSCSTVDNSDVTANYTRDSYLRLTEVQRPDGGCVLYSYNTSGQLSEVMRRDDCNPSSSGDYQELQYTADGLLTYLYTYNSGATLTAAKPYTYYQGRQVATVVNPVNSSYYTTLDIDQAGRLTEVLGASSLSQTNYNYAGSAGRDNRVTSINRYYTGASYDTWSLLFSWLGDQSQVTNPDSTTFGTTRDDFSKVVEASSPDVTYPTLYNYDAAGRLASETELFGSGSAVTHSFTYDDANRQTVADYGPRCTASGSNHALIQRSFDALPSGVSCPSGMSKACTNITGRLAYVDVVLMCSSSYTDGSLDQFTFYAYDDIGRLVEEYITDDTGRTADHQYGYTKDGTQSAVTTPSGTLIGWTYGVSGNNSSADLVGAMWRTNTSTPVVDTVEFNPFGPLAQYHQEDQDVTGLTYSTTIARNLAYRVTSAKMASNNATAYQLTLTEDAKGRATSRQYADVTGMGSSYFLYDNMDRVTCETTNSQSTCPTSGSDIKNSQDGSPVFTSAGDWVQLARPWNGSLYTYAFTLNSGTHQIGSASPGGTTAGSAEYQYNAFGDRSEDYIGSNSTFSHATRTYTYDDRHNVVNVRGQYNTGSAWDYYDVASAFDAKNRRVYKSFYDETTAVTSQWYFYYDSQDRLTEVQYTPNTSSSSTYSVFQLFWLGQRMVAYWETDYPGPTTSKRYTATDESGRIMFMQTWPSSGTASEAWAINPSAWGMDTNLAGPSVFQPLLFAGQYSDAETAVYNNSDVLYEPGLVQNHFRTYDPFVGAYLQPDPRSDRTWTSYVYVTSDPVTKSDRYGLDESDGPVDSDGDGVEIDVGGDSDGLSGGLAGDADTVLAPFGGGTGEGEGDGNGDGSDPTYAPADCTSWCTACEESVTDVCQNIASQTNLYYWCMKNMGALQSPDYFQSCYSYCVSLSQAETLDPSTCPIVLSPWGPMQEARLRGGSVHPWLVPTPLPTTSNARH